MPTRTRALVLAMTVALAAPMGRAAAQQQHAHDTSSIGDVDFRVSCAPEIRHDFDRAVALLHHMMYQESRKAFERIAEADPRCAMAHWGVAMTLFQPLWPARPGPAELERGRKAVERARELGPGTEREEALLAAAEAFYADPDAGWWDRIRGWADAMREAHEARPDDIETAAFFALSHLATGPVSDDRLAHNARAAEVLLEIHERVPTHPGAIHYTIHANDVTGRQDESLDVVRSYDDIAPSVPHALHMPTHIFVRLGDWPGTIEWNRKSADAALDVSPGEVISLHYAHAMDYLLYAHLQRGDDAAARAVLEEALGDRPHEEDFASAFHLAAMPARWAVERRDWQEAAAIELRTPDYLAWDRYPWPEGISWLARGLGAAQAGDLDAAREAEARMEELRSRAEEAGEREFAAYLEIDRRILASAIARARGEDERAVELARSAAELESTTQKNPITPGSLLPAYEALGDLLLALERPAKALAAYEASMEVWPGRYNTLLGAARAARAADDEARAEMYYARLLEIVGDAETTRPGVTEARERVGTRG